MDSDEEILSFSDHEASSSPVPERKLKRLKKATNWGFEEPTPTPPPDDDVSPPIRTRSSPSFGDLDDGSDSDAEHFKDVNDLSSGFDGLGVKESGAKRALEFDGEDEEDREGEMETEVDLEKNRDSLDEMEKADGEDEVPMAKIQIEEELEKNSHSLDELDEKKEKKKGKKKKKRSENGDDDYDETADPTTSKKRRGVKERRERVKELLAESQRLLRESRDASFKPVACVQKPVSSVLEKIRQRKLEISRTFVSANISSYTYGNDVFSRESTPDIEFENTSSGDLEELKVAKSAEITTALPVEEENIVDSVPSEEDLNEASRQTFRPPLDDTQDLNIDSQTSDSKDEMPTSPQEEVLAPSLRTMNLKLDSALPDDFSSDEEDNDKENIDPRLHGLTNSSPPNGDPVRAFVDEEAEEEDDSDDDLHRFPDNDEDEDNLDSEELNDMIATGYEEKPVDNDMRNQLHQKWLEQQDAAGTENLLQRLKCGSKQVETTLLENEEDSEGEEDEGDSLGDDDDAECLSRRKLVRMNLKKAKETIAEMFTDKDDVYISSDDEESESQLDKRHAYYRAEAQAAFLSPAEVEGSKEIFGRIKKLNVVPESRKRAKITSYFQMQSVEQSRSISSKSFLSRGSTSSLPSLRRSGSSSVRSFIFERDDSNSRSAFSMSDDSSDLTQIENRPRKTASARFTASQNRSNTQSTQTAAEINSGPSLHEILRRPSIKSSNCSLNSTVGQVEAIYAAFRLDQNMTRKEPTVSIRTV